MIEALGRFIGALGSMPAGWRLWVLGLVVMNSIIPLFFIGRRQARVVVAVFLIQGAFMFWLFRLQGFTRLLGLAHFGWIGLLYYLWRSADWESEPRAPWGIWLRALVTVDAISLAIDIADALRFLFGDWTPWR